MQVGETVAHLGILGSLAARHRRQAVAGQQGDGRLLVLTRRGEQQPALTQRL